MALLKEFAKEHERKTLVTEDDNKKNIEIAGKLNSAAVINLVKERLSSSSLPDSIKNDRNPIETMRQMALKLPLTSPKFQAITDFLNGNKVLAVLCFMASRDINPMYSKDAIPIPINAVISKLSGSDLTSADLYG